MTTQPKPGLLYKATYSLVFHTLSVRNKAVINVASALTDVITGARDACSLSKQNKLYDFPLISRDEKGRAYIAGKTMRVSQIVIDANAGDTPEQIAGNYPHISLPQVHAALAYYHANRTEVDAEIETADAFVETLMKADVPRVTLATLKERRSVSDTITLEKDLRTVTIEREPTLEEYVLEYKPA